MLAYRDHRCVGRATSIAWSPTTKELIEFGFLEKHLTDPGTRVSVDLPIVGTNYQARATVDQLPFVKHKRT